MKILYEDNHLLVVEKPAGMLSQPTQRCLESVETWARERTSFAHVVHRLDRPVSGILVVATSSKALSRLQTSIKEGKWEKTYLALVEGEVVKEGVWEHFLVKDDFCARVVGAGAKNGKRAILHTRVVGRFEGKTLLEVRLETGRYHQIRIQCAAMGHPIVGDQKYGSKEVFQEGAIALHHHRLVFSHPTLGDSLEFASSPCFGQLAASNSSPLFDMAT